MDHATRYFQEMDGQEMNGQEMNEWDMRRISYKFIKKIKPYKVIFWIIFTGIVTIVTAMFNVAFYSTITTNVQKGLVILTALLAIEILSGYCNLQTSQTRSKFSNDFMSMFFKKINKKILGSDWNKIKTDDSSETRRKIDGAYNGISSIVNSIFYEFTTLFRLIATICTITMISPLSMLIIIAVFYLFHRFYVSGQSEKILVERDRVDGLYRKLNRRYWKSINSMFDYLIHHESHKIIQIATDLKCKLGSNWDSLDFFQYVLSFHQTIVGNICSLTIVLLYVYTSGKGFDIEIGGLIVPLYLNLDKFVEQSSNIISFYQRCRKNYKSYEDLIPIIERSNTREVIRHHNKIYETLQFGDLEFRHSERENFCLRFAGSITIRFGESVLVTGNSGSGKSTLYDIINGVVPSTDYKCNVHVDGVLTDQKFHNIETNRTMVMQDSTTDFFGSVYEIITDCEENNESDEYHIVTNVTKPTDDEVWSFIRLVAVDDFIRSDLGNDIHKPLNNKLSGGQKSRLTMARLLYLANKRSSSMLILDEPDRGLPAETTVQVVRNIINWFKPKGIIMMTLHTSEAHLLPYDHVINVDSGVVRDVTPIATTATTIRD
jgi:ABC-type bacteriocin/lantibiotic exporter with double-glycine peptidase domain